MSGELSTQLSFGSYSGRLCPGTVMRDIGRPAADQARLSLRWRQHGPSRSPAWSRSRQPGYVGRCWTPRPIAAARGVWFYRVLTSGSPPDCAANLARCVDVETPSPGRRVPLDSHIDSAADGRPIPREKLGIWPARGHAMAAIQARSGVTQANVRGPIDPAGAGIYSQYSHNSAGR